MILWLHLCKLNNIVDVLIKPVVVNHKMQVKGKYVESELLLEGLQLSKTWNKVNESLKSSTVELPFKHTSPVSV